MPHPPEHRRSPSQRTWRWLACCGLAQALAASPTDARDPAAATQDPAAATQDPATTTVHAPPEIRGRLRDTRIVTRDVFSDAEAEENWFYRLVNALHVPSDPEILRREIWFDTGDRIGAVEAHELERVLRRTGWLGEVTARLVDATPGGGAPDEVDLEIASRDRLSLILNSTLSFVGGESRFDAALGDSNLFGTGKTLAVDYRQTDIDESGSLRFLDPQFADTDHRLALSAGDTDEGPFFSLGLSRPIRNRFDPFSYGITGRFAELDVDYFERGDTVASIPRTRTSSRAFAQRVEGPFDRRTTFGADVEWLHDDFDPAFGFLANEFRVPGDTDTLTLRAFSTREWLQRFDKVVGLDAIDFVEDLRLGATATASLGVVYRDEGGLDGQFQPLASVGFNAAISPGKDTYLTLAGGSSVRWFGDRARGWSAGAALHAFHLSLPAQTLAASIAIDAAFESQGLPIQLTVGEDNGLRGFPAREFAGSRVVRLNLEDRIRTGIELGSIHLGIVAFADVAWVHSNRTGLSQNNAISSAGIGLRLGSSNLLGGGVLRIDLAFPLTDVRGEGFGTSLSIATGQVFSFFGRDSVLGN